MKHFLLRSVIAVALTVPAFTAHAQDAVEAVVETSVETVAPKRGQMLRDADGKRIGRIDSVREDVATVIYSSKIVRVPLNTITVDGRTAVTSLTVEEIKN